jgi:hypothetical protein
MPNKYLRYGELMETGMRRVSKHLDGLKRIIIEISMMVFLISSLTQMFTMQVHDLTGTFYEGDFRRLMLVALAGFGGILTLSATILTFAFFLKGRTKKIRELEVKVVGAFMKALDESPLESNAIDKKYRGQLNPQ